MIGSIDHALIGIYFLSILLLGLFIKIPHSNSEYIFASRKLTIPAFVMTLVSTWYGGILEIGRFAYINGISTILIFGIFYYIFAILYAYILVPKIKSNTFDTIPQSISKSFGYKSGIIAAIIILLITSPAPYILIFSQIINFLYGIPIIYAACICTIISILYTLKGGFQAVIKTDTIQFIMMFAGFLFILIFLYLKYGGYNFIYTNLSPHMLYFPGNLNWSYIITWGFIAMLTFIDPNFYQRTFAGISTKKVQIGICISVIFWFIFDIMSITIALYAAAIISEINHSPYLDLIQIALPTIFQGLFIISLLSIVMSTIDSFLFISGCTIGKDLSMLISKQANIKTITQVKFGIIISGIVSIILTSFFENALDIWYVFGSFAVSCIMIPFISSLYNISLRLPFFCISAPGFITLLWFSFGNSNIDPMYPGITTSLILFLIFKGQKGFLNKA